ncbi:MAG: hypothetical protein J5508_03045, partial [Bacteroidales bacterium]|nr:hypothetical protein [Bacteroidales bacterium]
MKRSLIIALFTALALLSMAGCGPKEAAEPEQMLFIDTQYTDNPFAKDENIVKFNGKYFMYYSAYYPDKNGVNRLCVGI